MAQPGWAGRIIDGRYAVESVIGEGGMGYVLKARHKFTGAEVALKVLKPELELDTEIQMRFLAEARAPNAIGHPGIVSVIDAGKAPDGVLYLVMELLQGKPLRIPLARGELSVPDMRRILLELLEALGAAHTRGFVHRDLKPENVFLIAPAQQVKLLDFGIAKVLDAGIARVKTHSGATLGTPAYMAPEQFHDPSGVDPRADLWAVGVMAYEMLAGRLPFRADNVQAMLLAVATLEPDPITAYVRNAPPALEAFFRRALSRDKAGRFASAAEMAQAIAALPLAGQVSPQPVRAPQRAHTPSAPLPAGPAGQGMTMATGAGTFATPPPATSPTGPVVALAQSGVMAPPPPAEGTSKRAWVIGLGLASLVSIAIVIFAIAMTRSKGTTTEPPVATPGSGSGSGSGSATTVAKVTEPPPVAPDAATVVVQEPPVDASEGMAVDPAEAARRVGFLGPKSKHPTGCRREGDAPRCRRGSAGAGDDDEGSV